MSEMEAGGNGEEVHKAGRVSDDRADVGNFFGRYKDWSQGTASPFFFFSGLFFSCKQFSRL
jgi:hypothetical protein